jgi:hypothetical protein
MIRNEDANVVTIANLALGSQQLKQYFQPIAVFLGCLSRHSCQVAAWRVDIRDKPHIDGIGDSCEYDWDSCSSVP